MAILSGLFQTEAQRKKEYIRLVKEEKYREANRAWHQLHRGTYIGDFVFGANDGIVTTFAVVAAATGAGFGSGIIIIIGIASIVADGFSMGISNLLSLRSERDFIRMQRRREEWEVENYPEVEQAETRNILKRWGFSDELVEDGTSAISRNKERWVDFLMREELDLKEGEDAHPIKHGIVTFVAFIAAGFLPLLPYFFAGDPFWQFLISGVLAAATFFAVGILRTFVTEGNALKNGLEILVVGGFAAAVAYGIGLGIKTIFDVAL